jgi:hypothetical protein
VPESQPGVTGKHKKKVHRPLEETSEWNFFDPQEVGFAAVIAQLDEVTESGGRRRKAQRTETAA